MHCASNYIGLDDLDTVLESFVISFMTFLIFLTPHFFFVYKFISFSNLILSFRMGIMISGDSVILIATELISICIKSSMGHVHKLLVRIWKINFGQQLVKRR